jgi:hypothetical protein
LWQPLDTEFFSKDWKDKNSGERFCILDEVDGPLYQQQFVTSICGIT